jgi:hypothetical protein
VHVGWIDEAVYVLAERYKADCLIGDGSLLTESRSVHVGENFDLLWGVIEPPDTSAGHFIGKLLGQVGGLRDPAIQLTAEMLAFQLLGEGDTSGETKAEHVEALLNGMSDPVALTGPTSAS